MISNTVIREAIVTYLKANAPLVAALKLPGADEIREMQWQGTTFVYPNVRVGNITQRSYGNVECGISRVEFSVACFSEEASSKEASTLSGLVMSALHNKNFTENGLMFIRVLVTELSDPFRRDKLTWAATIRLKALVRT